MIFPSRNYLDGGQAISWIEVGASTGKDDQGLLAWFSNYGKMVDVVAPGVDIYSTYPENTYGTESGTSMATPMVAGLAAMIRSYYPKLSAAQVKEIILASVEKVDHTVRLSTGQDIPFTQACLAGGIVNVVNALKRAEGTKYSTK